MGIKLYCCEECGLKFYAKPKAKVVPLLWILLALAIIIFVSDLILKYKK
jgi:hypothetical protein